MTTPRFNGRTDRLTMRTASHELELWPHLFEPVVETDDRSEPVIDLRDPDTVESEQVSRALDDFRDVQFDSYAKS